MIWYFCAKIEKVHMLYLIQH